LAVHPEIIEMARVSKIGTVIWKKMTTKNERDVLYFTFWNFQVRAGVKVDL
jgi:hypothetical protein